MDGPKEAELRDPEKSKEIKSPKENAETRNPGANERLWGPEEGEGVEGPKETEIRDPEGSEATSDLEKTEKIREPEMTEGIIGPGDTKETRGPGETRTPKETEGRGPEAYKETKGSRGIRTSKETESRGREESEGIRGPEESEGIREPRESKGIRRPEESKGIRRPEEFKGIRGPGDIKTKSLGDVETRAPGVTRNPEKAENRGPKESKEMRVPGEIKTPEEIEDRDPKGSKETRTPDKPEGISNSRKSRGPVRFEIRKLEESDSSQDSGNPEEPGDQPQDLKEVKAMAEKGCMSLIKYFLFVFNIFFFVLGCLVFCFGLWILLDKNSFASYLGLSFVPLRIWSYVLAISGILTGLLSFLGCLGALKEIRCLLGLYFSFLLLLLTAQITIGVLIYTQHNPLERKVKDIVLNVIENYRKHPDTYSTAENWDFVQFQLRCCGWTSPQDWLLASSLRPNGSAPSGSGIASPTRSSDFLPPSQTSEPVLHVPCSCQNTSTLVTTAQSIADFPRASQPAAAPGIRATAVSTPGIPVVLSGPGSPGSPGTPARLRAGEVCSMPADGAVYQEGCSRSIFTWLHNNLISIVGISLGLGLLEVAALGLTMVLLPHTRAWGSRYQGLEGESSAAQGGGNCGSGSWSNWGMTCRCASWGSPSQSRLPAVVERWLPQQSEASRPSTIWSTCQLEAQGCE